MDGRIDDSVLGELDAAFGDRNAAVEGDAAPHSADLAGRIEAYADGGGGRRLLTYSHSTLFRNCRRAFKHRVIDGLTARQSDESLFIGSLYHQMHELRSVLMVERGIDAERAAAAAFAYLETACAGWRGDRDLRKVRHVARACFVAHLRRWGGPTPISAEDRDVHDSAFRILEVEPRHRIRMRNPATGAMSRTFDNGFGLDVVLERASDGLVWVRDYKTASSIHGDYIEKLWTDFQTRLYSLWIGRRLGRPVGGAIYDVVEKPRHVQREAFVEPESDWHVRLAERQKEAIDKLQEKKTAKGGGLVTLEEASKERSRVNALKTSARKIVEAETDEEFERRLDEAMMEDGRTMRLLLPFDAGDLEDAEAELWEIGQQILEARARGKWSKNTSQCYAFNRPCEFTQLCRTARPGDATPDLIAVQAYRKRDPVEELRRLSIEWLDRTWPTPSDFPADARAIMDMPAAVAMLPDTERDTSADIAVSEW